MEKTVWSICVGNLGKNYFILPQRDELLMAGVKACKVIDAIPPNSIGLGVKDKVRRWRKLGFGPILVEEEIITCKGRRNL